MERTPPKYVIIPFEKAIHCMEEFYDTFERQKVSSWRRYLEKVCLDTMLLGGFY